MESNGEMISFGAGVNSIAMTIMLVEQGWRGPIVFSDTGGEWPETYCYIETFERTWLQPRGLSITRLSPKTHPELYDTTRLGGLEDTLEKYCLVKGVVPFLAARWCTVQFKGTPLDAWREEQGIGKTCIGISASEPARVKSYTNTRYPLVESGITRNECRRIIAKAGLDQPIKSGCFFCPGQNLSNWRQLYYEHPDLYERAAILEDNASEKRERRITLDTRDISLREHAKRRWQGQMTMDLSEWIPCLCKL
ncbi:MAG: phosphoadenosine phosphosulfate reductase family protein [Deltaproteobacteria bacterium]|nr:phosphoadenosine phosphosulfate reductase family protein [Deltaproteobacteria bacterium]